MKWLTVAAGRLAAGALFAVAFAIMLPALLRERVPVRLWGAAVVYALLS